MQSQFDTLRQGAPARLARLRAKHARSLETIAKNHGTDSALYAQYVKSGPFGDRYASLLGEAYCTYSPDNGGVFYADSKALDHLRTAPDERSRRYQDIGYYCDEYQDSIATGRAVQLPSRKGAPVFLAYVQFSGSDGITIDADTYAEAADAWRAADSLAERIAEKEREYQAISGEAFRISEQNEQDRGKMAECRAKVSKTLAILRELPPASPNRQTVIDCARESRDRFHEIMDAIDSRSDRLAELIEAGADV
jgi:hypothetical protein